MRHSKREAEERDRILSTTAAKSKPRGCNRQRTRVTLRSVPREAQANRVLRSVSARRKKREGDCKKRLKKFLREQSARLAEQGFRERVKTQAALRKRLPKGSVGDALLKQRTSEACSACRSRRKANGPVVRNYVLKRFSPQAFALRVSQGSPRGNRQGKGEGYSPQKRGQAKSSSFSLM